MEFGRLFSVLFTLTRIEFYILHVTYVKPQYYWATDGNVTNCEPKTYWSGHIMNWKPVDTEARNVLGNWHIMNWKPEIYWATGTL